MSKLKGWLCVCAGPRATAEGQRCRKCLIPIRRPLYGTWPERRARTSGSHSTPSNRLRLSMKPLLSSLSSSSSLLLLLLLLLLLTYCRDDHNFWEPKNMDFLTVRKQKWSDFLLHETHCKIEQEHLIRSRWEFESVVAGNHTRNRRVAVLFKKLLSVANSQYHQT